MSQENEDFSKSVNSIDRGAIFPPRLGQDLSRNAFVVSVYAFEKKFDRSKGFCMTPKNRKFSTFSSFRRMSPEASIEYLGSFRSVQDVLWS